MGCGSRLPVDAPLLGARMDAAKHSNICKLWLAEQAATIL
jgi:hypothetical protein